MKKHFCQISVSFFIFNRKRFYYDSNTKKNNVNVAYSEHRINRRRVIMECKNFRCSSSLSIQKRRRRMLARVGIVSSTLQERANFSRALREGDTPWRCAACCYLDKFQIRSSVRGVYGREARSSDGEKQFFPRNP